MKKLTKSVSMTMLVLVVLFLCLPGPAAAEPALPEQWDSDLEVPETHPARGGGGNIWFVSPTGAGTDCSRANPCPLEYCVEVKANTDDTIYVEQGFYQSADLDDNLLYIQKSLTLIGSCTWNLTGPVVCAPQNELPHVTPSYLDGGGLKRVIAIEGPGISVTVEGFHIQDGNADGKLPKPGSASVIGAGGGIYANDVFTLSIRHNYIWSNTASESGINISEISEGGGIYASNVQNVDITENTLIFNSASSPAGAGLGGGLFVYMSGTDGMVQISSNRFHENMIGNNDYSQGAGAYLFDVDHLRLLSNIFEYHNHTVRHYWTHASAIDLNIVTDGYVAQNMFTKNYGVTLVEFNSFTGTFDGNRFWDNEAFYDLWIQNTNTILLKNNFFGKLYGWTPSPSSDSTVPRGGISTIVYIGEGCGEPVVEIIHNTFGFAEYAVQVDNLVAVDIYRNIFSKHSKMAIDIMNPANTNVDVDENLFWDNFDNGETGSVYWTGDPLFTAPWSGDFHLQVGSAAIDRVSGGSVPHDIDGQMRPTAGLADLGADEYILIAFLPVLFH